VIWLAEHRRPDTERRVVSTATIDCPISDRFLALRMLQRKAAPDIGGYSFSFSYSTLASFRMGMSGSAGLHNGGKLT
jgi:hypothetical protein